MKILEFEFMECVCVAIDATQRKHTTFVFDGRAFQFGIIAFPIRLFDENEFGFHDRTFSKNESAPKVDRKASQRNTHQCRESSSSYSTASASVAISIQVIALAVST